MYYLPRLRAEASTAKIYREFAQELKNQGHAGAIEAGVDARVAYATDNSPYQLRPQLVLKPESEEDIHTTLRLLALPRFRSVRLYPRGGGTGTNGQALGTGCVLDSSPSYNRILELDPQAAYARVQPGVTLAQLNAAAARHGLRFGPSVSTADRATIGGMIATDASGKGSCVYGKTSDHLLELKLALVGGQSWRLQSWQLENIAVEEPHFQFAHLIHNIAREHKAEINRRFPDLQREATGYNLKRMANARQINPLKLIAGSEGSLGLVTEAKLKLVPALKHLSLCVVSYNDFHHALCSGVELRALRPDAIETMDKTLVQLALGSNLSAELRELLPASHQYLGGINCIELSADSAQQLTKKVKALSATLARDIRVIHHGFAGSAEQRQAVWQLRSQAVGLLGRLDEYHKPVAGIEDCALPPERLPDFVLDLQLELGRRQLRYGVYGHLDAGCLHLRPALDTRAPDYRQQLRSLSDFCYQLVKNYGGVFWGEHGKGLRSAYSEDYFGAELYGQMQRIKRYFDPYNQLNSGKIATAQDSGKQLLQLDQPYLRVEADRQVSADNRAYFPSAFSCNGNGACFSSNAEAVMCPSYQLSGDRVHSPKGRADLLREWLRLLSQHEFVLSDARNRVRKLKPQNYKDDFSHNVERALHGCLGCSACAGSCPTQVNIPELRSTFLHIYYSRYRRPARDWLLTYLENSIAALAGVGAYLNPLLRSRAATALGATLGLSAIPRFDSALARKLQAPVYDDTQTHFVVSSSKAQDPIILADPYTLAYDNQPLLACYRLLELLEVKPRIVKLRASGQLAHARGLLGAYRRVQQRNRRLLGQLNEAGLAVIVPEPSAYYFLREQLPEAQLISPVDYLLAQREQLPQLKLQQEADIRLLRHCNEASRNDAQQWRQLFAHFDLALELSDGGCCGRSGVYGHLSEHQANSHKLFERNWLPRLHDEQINLATGFSCRSISRELLPDLIVEHPLGYLYRLLNRRLGVRPPQSL